MIRIRLFAASCAATLLLSTAPMASADDSLFQALGGKEGIRRVVDTFIPIVLDNPRIKSSFNDVDLERLANLLAEQFCELSGGPCKYSGKDMKTIHKDLELTNMHFNALAEDLQEAMTREGVPSRVQNKLLAKLAPMQRDIVTR